MPLLRPLSTRALWLLLVVPFLLSCGGDGSGPVTASSMSAPGGTSLTGTVGQSLALEVVVTGSNGKAFPGGLVSFAITSGGGSVSPSQASTDQTGKASTTWTLGTTAGSQGLSASLQGASVQFTATAHAGTPSAIEPVTTFPGYFPPGQALDQAATFVVRDQYNNPVASVNVTFQASDGGSVSPAQGTTGTDGRASTTWTLGPLNGVQSLTATISGTAPASVTAEAYDPCMDWQTHNIGQTSTGTITSSSCEINFQNQARFADLYTFSLGAAGGYSFNITSDFTDPLLLLLAPGAVAGRQEEDATSLDVKALLDNGGGTRQYYAYVSGGPGGVGDYAFSSSSISDDMKGCEVWVASKNLVSTQALSAEDCYWSGPSYVDLVEIWLDEGETLVAEMSSPNSQVVDPWIDLMTRDIEGVYQVFDSDDDGGPGFDSRLEHTITAGEGGSGFYFLGFSSALINQTGPYTLTITSSGGASGTPQERAPVVVDPTTGARLPTAASSPAPVSIRFRPAPGSSIPADQELGLRPGSTRIRKK